MRAMDVPDGWIAHVYRKAAQGLAAFFDTPRWVVDICSPEWHTEIVAGVSETRIRSWHARFTDEIPVTWHVTDVEPHVILFE